MDFLQGLQTLDLSKSCAEMPYLINFCNSTQVRKDTGFVRSIRRTHQATYPAAMKNETPPGKFTRMFDLISKC